MRPAQPRWCSKKEKEEKLLVEMMTQMTPTYSLSMMGRMSSNRRRRRTGLARELAAPPHRVLHFLR
jgi:hypothetical protein